MSTVWLKFTKLASLQQDQSSFKECGPRELLRKEGFLKISLVQKLNGQMLIKLFCLYQKEEECDNTVLKGIISLVKYGTRTNTYFSYDMLEMSHHRWEQKI